MSRSYKKTAYCGDHKGKEKKRIANSKVRSTLKKLDHNFSSHGAYKKMYGQWEICDWYFLESWEEYWEWAKKAYKRFPEIYKKPLSKKEAYRAWYKEYKMK